MNNIPTTMYNTPSYSNNKNNTQIYNNIENNLYNEKKHY